MSTDAAFELKAVYTVPELARMGNVHRDEMRRALRKAGVPIEREGRTGRVLLEHIRRAAPELWASIQLVTRMREAAAAGLNPRR